jgi:hypothetical protein
MDIKTIENLAYEFALSLVGSKFDKAQAQFTSANQLIWSVSSLKKAYEDMIEYGEGVPQHIEVMQTDPMNGWASYRDGDIGWSYVGIVGNGYSEAVALIYCNENGHPRIRDIEWGRP